MKKTVLSFILILSAVLTFSLTSCVMVSDSYSDADKYSAGACELEGSKVKSLSINWSTGKVSVSRHDLDTVTVTETCKNDLEEDQQVHTWLDGDTLRIQYCKSGQSFFFKMADKNLEVKIPMDMELEKLSINGSSSDPLIEDITADCISVNVSSGDIKTTGCSADTYDISSSSGTISIDHKGSASSINASSSSGEIEINAEHADFVKASTSSGDITLDLSDMPAETVAASSSGDIRLNVPENAEFTARVSTSSGDFDSSLALAKDGGRYISGSGSNSVDISTSSGDIRIS